ncbi:pseudouridine synthase [Methylocella sp.]|uniref:pseudouridine synthase n=1 Tax=Methylocella sp. TaxID=1978226 RepID=UPI003782E40C
MPKAPKPPRPSAPARRKPRLAPLVGTPPAARPKAAGPKPAAPAAEKSTHPGLDRVAKFIARAGACSRRDAEALIAEGRVTLNGAVLASPAVNVGPNDQILIDGAPLAPRARTRLFLFHKPRGLVTTDRDPEGRPTVFDHVRTHFPDAPRLVSVGRLDINTEGLLLLTNDGGLARALELPSTGWVRRYRVRAKGEIEQPALDALRRGVEVDGVVYAEIEATLDRRQGANCWLTMSLREGKNREIKRVLEHLGLEVNRLIRLSYGPFQLSDAPEGALDEVKTKILRDQLGAALADAAGADFSGPEGDAPQPKPAAQQKQAAPRREAAAPRREAPTPRREATAPRRDESRRGDVRRGERGPSRGRETPEPEPKREKPAPRVRKHVSTMRAEAARRPEADPRKRIERAETTSRTGRVVAVERVTRVRPAAAVEAPARPARGPRRDATPREDGARRAGGGLERSGDKRGRAPRPAEAGARRSGEDRRFADKPRGASGKGGRDFARKTEGGFERKDSRDFGRKSAEGSERKGAAGFGRKGAGSSGRKGETGPGFKSGAPKGGGRPGAKSPPKGPRGPGGPRRRP